MIEIHPYLYSRLEQTIAGPDSIPRSDVAVLCHLRQEIGCILPPKRKNNTEQFIACTKARSAQERKEGCPFSANCPVALSDEGNILKIATPKEHAPHVKKPREINFEDPLPEEEPEFKPTPAIENLPDLERFADTIFATPLKLEPMTLERIIANSIEIAGRVIGSEMFSPEMNPLEITTLVKAEAARLRNGKA